MKNLKLWLIMFLILIVGLVLIYLTASQFFTKKPKEIAFESEEAEEIPEIDYLALNFELPNIKGERVKFNDYQDKIIILNFWTTWNSAAQDQFAILESYYQEIKDKEDVVLLTINSQEDKSVVSNFIRRGEYILPVLLDQDGEISELYKINSLPATFFINKQGRVKETYIGILNKEEINNKVEKLYTR